MGDFPVLSNQCCINNWRTHSQCVALRSYTSHRFFTPSILAFVISHKPILFAESFVNIQILKISVERGRSFEEQNRSYLYVIFIMLNLPNMQVSPSTAEHIQFELFLCNAGSSAPVAPRAHATDCSQESLRTKAEV